MVVLALEFSWFIVSPATAGDSSLAPIDSIPKLSESFDLVSYKDIFIKGSLLPDKILWDTNVIRTGISETIVNDRLPDSFTVIEQVQSRTREQQWQFIRGLLLCNNYSMHYYILADIYYEKQLYGYFKTYEWVINGVGKLRVYLHAENEKDTYRVWLLRFILDAVSPDRMVYKKGAGL